MNERDRGRLIAAYAKQPLPLDHLPYTVEFLAIANELPNHLMRDIWRELVRLRKAGSLPRKTARQPKRRK